jgi:hypothetical protein
MVVCHRSPKDGLASRFKCRCQALSDESELALSLQGQGPSIKLIALPFFWLARHRDQIIVGLLSIDFGSFQVATQRVDTRAQRDIKSGWAGTLARVAPFEIAPPFLHREYLIPSI